jgi:hypothetical protein
MKNILIVILVVVVAIGGFLGLRLYREHQALLDALESNLRTSRLLIDGTYIEESERLTVDGRLHLSFEAVRTHLFGDAYLSGSQTRFYLPVTSLGVVYEDPALGARIEADADDLNFPVRREDGRAWVPLDLLETLTPLIKVEGPEDLVMLFTREVEEVRFDGPLEVYYLDTWHPLQNDHEQEGWRIDGEHLVTNDGWVGRVQAETITSRQTVSPVAPVIALSPAPAPTEPFHLLFEFVGAYGENAEKAAQPDRTGIDVLAPTWFELNVDGILLNEADRVDFGEGMAVWGVATNSFDPDWTTQMLNDPALRRKTIAQLMFYAAFYDLDGINIDFENIYLSDQELLTTFVAELSALARPAGLVLSMDVTVPGGSDQWSKVYDRAALDPLLDYLVLMAYDEHWASSPRPGSVASRPWVERGITSTLEITGRPDKLLLGLPFYTRVWDVDGNRATGSATLTIRHTGNYLADKNTERFDDPAADQTVVSFSVDGQEKRIWLEDARSMTWRLKLASEYGLAGVAGWRRGFETPEILRLIENELRETWN